MSLSNLLKRVSMLVVVSMAALVSFAQNQTVKGVVTDDLGDPMIGVNVSVKGTTNGAVTDFNGNYSLQNVKASDVLVFTFIGYTTKEVAVGNQTTINMQMFEDKQALDEVVVIGYQTVKRRDLTGSVASVSGKNVASAPVSNVAQALQGKLPGVNVTSQDGRPDAEISIRVRGGGSISQSNDPLILIDGVPGSISDIPSDQVESIDVLKDASSTAIYGARGANGVILVTTKGAKEGKARVTYSGYAKWNEPTKYLSALGPYDYLAFIWGNLTAKGDVSYTNPFVKLYGLENGGIERYRNTPKYDAQKDIYNGSFSHNHDLSISGGTEKTKILLSANYSDDQGMKVNSYSKRASFSAKVNQKINQNLDVALDARYSQVEKMGNEGTTSGAGSILSSAYRFRPISMDNILGDKNALREGSVEQYGKQTQWDVYNPYERANDYEPLSLSQSVRATGSLNWKIVKGLTYHTDLTLARNYTEGKTWSGAIYNNYLDDATGEKLFAGAVNMSMGRSWSSRWTNTLNYDLEINESNHLNVLLGHEVSNSHGSSLRIQADHFPANYTKENAFAMVNQYDKKATNLTEMFSSGVTIPGRIVSFFGRANYNLLDRYLLTVTFRADGSSKFSPDHRWGYFPAAAFAWRLSEEKFIKENTEEWLDNLKLRLSYGTVGNDGISADLWSQMWTSETDSRWIYTINGSSKPAYDLASNKMANRDLKWETTITRNLGIDFSLFRGRLNGSIDVYKNSTKDLLMATTLPGITGFTSTFANIGETSNKGVEISLNGTIFENKDWTVSAGFNINFNKNNVEKLADGVTGTYGTQWVHNNLPNNDFALIEGKPVGLVRGYVYDGFYTVDDFTYADGTYTLKPGVPDFQAIGGVIDGIGANERPAGQQAYPGLPKYKDVSGDGVINEDDFDVIGDMNPVHTGGFNLNVQYKNFDLGAYFNWSVGNDIYNINKLATLYCYKEASAFNNHLDIVNDCWKMYDVKNGQLVRYSTPDELRAANADAKLPLIYHQDGVPSTLGIEDGSYLRLNTLTLGYTLPKNVLQKIGTSNIRIYGSIYNVFTLTNYSGLDPEVNAAGKMNNSTYPTPGVDWGTYPRARSFVLGVNVTF